MLRTASLALFLFAFWLLMSGHYTLWLVGAGLLVSVGIAFVGRVTAFADEEGHPVERIVAGLSYWPWLAVEIIKSSVGVARVIIDVRRPVAPEFFELDTGRKSVVGAVTYANSITLTPGTVTVGIDRERRLFRVHALSKAAADDLKEGGMERRVARFEGEGRP